MLLPHPWTSSLGRRLGPLVALVLGGCVVPVAPQWDDAEVNYPPYVETATPSVGDIFTPGNTDQREIDATLSDQNVGDHLFIRWLVDYPSSDMNRSHLVLEVELASSGTAVRSPVHIQPKCDMFAVGSGTHRWLMSVSDRKFLDALNGDSVNPDAPLDSVPTDANRIRVFWLLNCP